MQNLTPLSDVGTLEIQHHIDVQCVRHLHNEAEVVLVTQGILRVLLDRHEVVLQAGQALYITPFEMHSYVTDDHSRCTILVFSTGLVPDFTAVTGNAQPGDPVFSPSSSIVTQCTAVDPATISDTLHRRALLYPLCCEIVDQCHFSEESLLVEDSIIHIQRYIIENISLPITLKSAASAVGLNPSYLSRMFKKAKGVAFTEHVNLLRCSHAARMLTVPSAAELPITEIAYQCGFESIRTFNRQFKQCYGITPSAMRKHGSASFPDTKKRPSVV